MLGARAARLLQDRRRTLDAILVKLGQTLERPSGDRPRLVKNGAPVQASGGRRRDCGESQSGLCDNFGERSVSQFWIPARNFCGGRHTPALSSRAIEFVVILPCG